MNNKTTVAKKANRHAYMIIAHGQFELLKLLCKLLDHPNNDFFIHIDKRVTDFNFDEFKLDIKFSQVFFVPRFKINWGGISMVNCEIELLRAATQNGTYSYYHLLSGADLPLRSADEIYSFFESKSGKEFIHFCGEKFCKDNVERFSKYHFTVAQPGKRNIPLAIFRRCSLAAQNILKIDRAAKHNVDIKLGSQWFSITNGLAQYVLEHEEWIKKTFVHTHIPDEMFLQTLIYGTEYYANRYMPELFDDYRCCMRYVDWKRGSPYIFTLSDFDELITSEYLFARKFDFENEKELCKKLENHLFKSITSSNQ